ncbi:transmembrane protein 201 [Patella vulgata]|uniref:transmembrane protein 201 n=1 Tax=Patella vulgata TaxID=6465 RepID=UPI0021805476|nr:transmembrane protein 201 [Patella vulgata]
MESWLSAVGAVSAGLVGSALLVHKYRYGDRTVNCWFCNNKTVVPYGNVNCFDCPHCEQYNGFEKDGGYNKTIPAQFYEDMNHVMTCQAKEYLGATSTLCATCQQNQQLKIRQLSIFEPLIEENYDIEVEEYKTQLERNYKLCVECQTRVDNELAKQNKTLYKKLIGTKFDECSNLDETVCSTNDIEETEAMSPLCQRLFTVCSGLVVFLSVILVCNMSLYTAVISRHIPSIILDVTYHTVQPHAFPLIVLTTFLTLLSKLIIGKNRLYMVDNIHSFTCLILLLSKSQYVPYWMFPDLPVLLIHSISLITAICCLIRSRPLSNATTATFKRLSLDKSNSSESSTAVSSVSTSRKAVDIAETHQVKQYNPIQELDGLDFNVCSIGSKPIASKDSGMFSWTGSACSIDTISSLPHISSTTRQRRPLISPAKLHFNASKEKSFGHTMSASSISLFSNGATYCEEKQSLFGNTTVSSRLPESVNTMKGIKAPSLFQNMNSVISPPAPYSVLQQTKLTSEQTDISEFADDTQLTTEKLSMFNLQQSLIRPKMFENHQYLNRNPSVDVSSHPVQSSSYSYKTDFIPAQCAVDSTTNPEIEQEVSMSRESTCTTHMNEHKGFSTQFIILSSGVVVMFSVVVNIAVHVAWKHLF